MDLETAGIFNQRREVGRIYDRKKKAAEEMPVYPNVPAEPVSMAEITAQYEAAMKTNRETTTSARGRLSRKPRRARHPTV